jgi:uncharacterized protein (DUF58 family)
MLSPELIKKIKKIHIKSRRQVDTMMAGQYKSVFRGSGMEFEEVREYTPGDEVKTIDWKVSARMGRPFVKTYKEEREVVVMLLVDMSASGKFGTFGKMKIETAAEIASILAFNAIKNNDKVGVILFTDRVEKYIPPKKGSSHIWRVIKEIFTFQPEYTGTDIDGAIQFLGRVSRKKTVTFVISDFVAGGYLKKLKIASKRHEVINVLLSDPKDFHLPKAGLLLAEDFETGKTFYIDSSDKQSRKLYREKREARYSESLETFKKADIDCIELSTTDDVADALIKYFRYRERKFR